MSIRIGIIPVVAERKEAKNLKERDFNRSFFN